MSLIKQQLKPLAGVCFLIFPLTVLGQSGHEGIETTTLEIDALLGEADQQLLEERRLQRMVNIARLNDQLEELENRTAERAGTTGSNNPQQGYRVPSITSGVSSEHPSTFAEPTGTGEWVVQLIAGERALLSSPGGAAVTVSQGDSLAGGQVVTRISASGVTLESADGQVSELSLPYKME